MGCFISHQSNAVNIPHQTNAGLVGYDIQYVTTRKWIKIFYHKMMQAEQLQDGDVD
jgi:hypothetical protein